MNILTNSNNKIRRRKGNAFQMLENSDVKIKKDVKNKSVNGINVINGINNEASQMRKVNFFEKQKIFNIKLHYMYNQNFTKEEEILFKSFDYFTRHSKNKIKSGTPVNFHILIGKDFLKDSTYIFSMIPKEEIVINTNESGINKFSNVCMIHLSYSAGNNECLNKNIIQFPEFPVFHLDFNTNKSIKFCKENDNVIKKIISLITNNSIQVKNNSLSKSGDLLSGENVNYSGVQNNKNKIENEKNSKIIFETQSLILKYINHKYYKLFQKNLQNTLYIKKELLNKIFQKGLNKSLFLKVELFDKLKNINNHFMIEDKNILTTHINIDGNNVKVIQNSMVNHGAGFLEFYKNKKDEFSSNLLKKYLMALYYIENLKHRNLPFEANSNIVNMKEIQNSYYLGFDFEYIIINHLKKYGKNKSLLIPFISKLENNKYILYYLYVINNEVYLYEILNNLETNGRNMINKINNKVENYIKRIFMISFLSKAPLKYIFKGLVQKNIDFKINFIDENKINMIYSHLHLFYKVLNPTMELKEIYGNKGTDEMLKFITLLLEL